MTVFGDITLSLLESVTEEHVEHTRCFSRIGGRYCDESACLRAHSGLPHHAGRVLTKSLRALYSVLFVTELCDYSSLLLLVVRKVGVGACCYLK